MSTFFARSFLSSRIQKAVLVVSGLWILVFWTFHPVVNHQFTHFDDQYQVTENPLIRDLEWDQVTEIFRTSVLGVYSPLATLSFALEYRFFGLDPFIYHLNNLLLHLGVTGLVFYFFLRIGSSWRTAALGALLFAVHPMKVESVAWVTERKDVLFAFFYMLALCQYIRYIKNQRFYWYGLVLLWSLLSILAKPMALSLPIVMLIMDWWFEREFNPRLLMEKIPFLAIFSLLVWQTYSLNIEISRYGFLQQGLIWLWCLAFYFSKFFLPVGLMPIYRLTEPVSLRNPVYVLSVAIVLATGFLWWRCRRFRWFNFSMLFFCASIFAVIRFSEIPGLNIVADRYLYLPSLGICMGLGYAVEKIYSRLKLTSKPIGQGFVFAVSILLVVLMIQTHRHTRIWKDDGTLWQYVLARNPEEVVAHNNLGLFFFYRNDWQKALDHFDQALRINSDYVFAYNNRALVHLKLGRRGRAMKDLNQALKRRPRYIQALMNRSRIHQERGKHKKARRDLNRVIKIDPYFIDAIYQRGVASLGMKDFARAFEDFDRVIALNPGFSAAYAHRAFLNARLQKYDQALQDLIRLGNLRELTVSELNQRGILYTFRGDLSAALKDFHRVMQLAPSNAEAYNNRGNVYFRQRALNAAFEDFDHALQLNPGYLEAYNNRAHLNLLRGEFEAALNDYTRALQLNPNLSMLYYQRSMVYAVMGEVDSAIHDARVAQEMGMQGMEEYIRNLEGFKEMRPEDQEGDH